MNLILVFQRTVVGSFAGILAWAISSFGTAFLSLGFIVSLFVRSEISFFRRNSDSARW